LIVFSAALHGGLADLDLAAALFEALIDPGDCFHLSSRTGRVYTDLLVAAQGLADQETRRWYPDDTLICLIARVSLTTDLNRFRADLAANKSVATRRNRIADRIWNRVEAELERQQKLESGYDPRRLPQKFKSLLDSIRIVMHSELPSILAEYASRRVDCRSLLGPSVGRIYGDPVIARPVAPAAEDETIKAMEEVEPPARGGAVNAAAAEVLRLCAEPGKERIELWEQITPELHTMPGADSGATDWRRSR
jgi:hypothetical protein